MRLINRFQLATIGGIPIYIHWSFWLLVIWVVISTLWQSGGDWVLVGWRLMLIAGMVVSVIIHELGHAFAAAAFQIRTRDITMYPFGGVAYIEKLPEKPLQELVLAIAGPLMNFLIIGVITAGLLLSGFSWDVNTVYYFGLRQLTIQDYFIQLVQLNLLLAIFNLIPAFPMDGGRVLRAFLAMRMPYMRATTIAAVLGQGFGIIFASLGYLVDPMLILIGYFVFFAAKNEKNKIPKGQRILEEVPARLAVMTTYPILSVTAPLKAAVDALLDSQARSFLIVDPDGRPAGTLSRERIIKALRESPLPNLGEADTYPSTPITEVMDERLITVDANTSLSEVMHILQEKEVPFLLVTEKVGDKEVLLGLIDAENIAEYLLIIDAQ